MAERAPRGGWSVCEHGLAAHLRDAIRLNRSRRPRYARLGGARAWTLSTALIAAERALLPAARVLDAQAGAFVAAGVPILVADLMPMSAAGSVGERDAAGGRGERVRLRTSDLRLLDVWREARGGRFAEAADAIRGALNTVRRLEASSGRAYALTAHVLDSAGLMALRAPIYAEATGGATLPLSRRLVVGHLPLVPAALRLDVAAHPVQARGVGLFVRDLPAVPFVAEHDAHA